jgi:hypothetical protein
LERHISPAFGAYSLRWTQETGCNVKSNKTKKRVIVADGMTQEEIDLENAAGDALCNIGNAVMKGRSYKEQIALAKKLTAQVEAAGIAEKVALDFKGVDDNTLGELATALTNELSDSISKGRTLAEQIGLIKQLRYQVETIDSPEPKPVDEAKQEVYAADDEMMLTHAEHFFRNLHRKIYQNLCFLVSIDGMGDIFNADEEKTLKEMKENWLVWHKDELANCGPDTIKLKKAS